MKKALAVVALPLLVALTVQGKPKPMPAEREVNMNPPTSAAIMNERVNNIKDMGFGDAFRTMKLPDGRWLSLVDDNADPGGIYPARDNAFVIWTTNTQYRVKSTADPMGNAFPRWSDGTEFWPYQAVFTSYWPGGPVVMYVTGTRIKVTGPLQWTSLGAWIAIVHIPWNGDPKFMRYVNTPSSGSDDSVVQWNGAIARQGSYAYIHGVKDRGPDVFHARDAGYVARVNIAAIEYTNKWEYWTGTGWSKTESEAVSTIPTGGPFLHGSESSYTLHKRPNGQWQVTTKWGGTIDNKIGRYVSDTPYGPWSWEQLGTDCGFQCYLVGAAETIPTTSGNLLVYYNRTDDTPFFLEVPQ